MVRLRFVLTGLALAGLVYAALHFAYDYRRAGLIGLSEQPCTAQGRSVTGSDRDDWAALCAWRAENRQLGGQRPDVVMIGDSLTEHWPGEIPGVVRRGVSGQTGAQVLLRFRQDALDLHPRVIHILLGANDLLGFNGPFTARQFEGTVLDMVELAELHGARVILGTIPPMRDFGGYVRGDPAPGVARLNAVLRSIASRRGLVLADYHAALVMPDGTMRAELFAGDGRHLNARGYAVMQRVFDAALESARLPPGSHIRSP